MIEIKVCGTPKEISDLIIDIQGRKWKATDIYKYRDDALDIVREVFTPSHLGSRSTRDKDEAQPAQC